MGVSELRGIMVFFFGFTATRGDDLFLGSCKGNETAREGIRRVGNRVEFRETESNSGKPSRIQGDRVEFRETESVIIECHRLNRD